MARRVITYQASSQLIRSDSLFQKEYADCIHIAATPSLKKGIGESFRAHRWFQAPIIAYSEFFSELAGTSWSSSKAQLKQFLRLSEILSGYWEHRKMDLLLLQSIERNQLQVLRTLRVLTELGIVPSSFGVLNEELSRSEKAFLTIWEEMLPILTNNSRQISRFLNGDTNAQNTVKILLHNWGESLFKKNGMDRRIAQDIRRTSNLREDNWRESIEKSLKKRKLILHGFYFITPIQERVLSVLEKEFELVFLNLYDSRFPNTFQTVERFLEIGRNKTDSVVRDNVQIHPLAAKLVESFEGGSTIELDQKVSVYSDLAHFVESELDLIHQAMEDEENEELFHLYTPRSKELKEQLIANEFVPHTQKKLTDYPVGRFLYRLHQIKRREADLKTGVVSYPEQLSVEALLDFFSSGLLVVDGEDTRGLIKPFEMILPYCKNMSTFDGWIEKIGKLLKEKEKWEQRVLQENPSVLSDRAHTFHALPMRQLSYFAVEKDDLEKIIAGIESLKAIHTVLFSKLDSAKVNITTHLKMLEELVLKDAEVYFKDDEKTIVRNLIEEISELKDDEIEFSLKDLSNGLLFYLDGTLTEMENQETIDKIFSFDNADGAPFKINRKFHLAFADSKALPISQEFSMWPITRGTLRYLQQAFHELQLLEERKNQSNSITRYLLYTLFHSADEIRLSFAKNLGSESRLELALYLKLLGCKPENEDRIKREEVKLKEKVQDDSQVALEGWTESMKQEAGVCGKRSGFSFILNKHSTFQEDFHHSFLYQNFIHALENMALTKGNTREIVDDWFPQWNSTKKDFLFEARFKNRCFEQKTIKVGRKEYSPAIKFLHLLPDGTAKKDVRSIQDEEINVNQPNPGLHCMYCPYRGICTDAFYSIDLEDHNYRKDSNR